MDQSSHSECPSFRRVYQDFWAQTWGEYPQKPAAQVEWDKQVQKAALHIARLDKVAANSANSQDSRPRVYDANSKTWILVDSGAQVSIVPHKWYPRTTPDAGRALQAVNGTRIATYGVKHIQFRFGHNFNHTCIVADVDEPVLGFNFLMEHKLDFRWKGAHAILHHDRKPPIPLKLGPAPAPHNLGLAVVTFKQYADAIKAKEVVKAKPVPAQYQQILDKYPGIFSARISKTPRHNVTHSIDTGDQPPCMAKPRPIMPGTHKYVEGEKTLKEMEQVGIVERIGPGEPML